MPARLPAPATKPRLFLKQPQLRGIVREVEGDIAHNLDDFCRSESHAGRVGGANVGLSLTHT